MKRHFSLSMSPGPYSVALEVLYARLADLKADVDWVQSRITLLELAQALHQAQHEVEYEAGGPL